MSPLSIIVAVILVVGLFGINVWLYRANQATPVPEGCEDLTPQCATCGIVDCAIRSKQRK